MLFQSTSSTPHIVLTLQNVTRQAEPKLLASLMSSCLHSFRQEVESSLFSQCVECNTAATGRHVVREIFWDVYCALMKKRTYYVSNCLLLLLHYIYLHFIYLCFSDFILMFLMIQQADETLILKKSCIFSDIIIFLLSNFSCRTFPLLYRCNVGKSVHRFGAD